MAQYCFLSSDPFVYCVPQRVRNTKDGNVKYSRGLVKMKCKNKLSWGEIVIIALQKEVENQKHIPVGRTE